MTASSNLRAFLARVLVSIAAAVAIARGAMAQTLAFPGAEGEGRHVSGGRGGDVYHVSTLADSGAGSLRSGLDTATGPRTIVFDVSGTIALDSGLAVRRSDLTIAGETAPGQGVAITQFGLNIGAGNVLMRHVRVRPGDAKKGTGAGFNGDAISINASNVILDHVSTSWGIDENLSVAARGGRGITVQYCTISQGLAQTGLYHGELHPDYNPGGSKRHSMGSLIKPPSGNGVVTFSHNLWSDNGNRNPAVGTYKNDQTLKVDIRNNVLYNNRGNGYSSGESKQVDMNYVGNYVIAGPNTSSGSRSRMFESNPANHVRIYQAGNLLDNDANFVRSGDDGGWAAFKGSYTRLPNPVDMAPVNTDTAQVAYHKVLDGAGAFPWARDSVDKALISEVQNFGGQLINSQEEVGGYPVLPSLARAANWDADLDGMPDGWETEHGLNPSVKDNNGMNPDGYTNLERYLHNAAAPESSTAASVIAPGSR